MTGIFRGQVNALLTLVFASFVASGAYAQDASSVDPERYTVVFENDQVRVLRISYGPHEKSVMHSHPNSVTVFLSDASARFTFPDGSTEDTTGKSGQAIWNVATQHLPENTSDKALEVVQIELK